VNDVAIKKASTGNSGRELQNTDVRRVQLPRSGSAERIQRITEDIERKLERASRKSSKFRM